MEDEKIEIGKDYHRHLLECLDNEEKENAELHEAINEALKLLGTGNAEDRFPAYKLLVKAISGGEE